MEAINSFESMLIFYVSLSLSRWRTPDLDLQRSHLEPTDLVHVAKVHVQALHLFAGQVSKLFS
jgi:hypothetical protein